MNKLVNGEAFLPRATFELCGHLDAALGADRFGDKAGLDYPSFRNPLMIEVKPESEDLLAAYGIKVAQGCGAGNIVIIEAHMAPIGLTLNLIKDKDCLIVI